MVRNMMLILTWLCLYRLEDYEGAAQAWLVGTGLPNASADILSSRCGVLSTGVNDEARRSEQPLQRTLDINGPPNGFVWSILIT